MALRGLVKYWKRFGFINDLKGICKNHFDGLVVEEVRLECVKRGRKGLVETVKNQT